MSNTRLAPDIIDEMQELVTASIRRDISSKQRARLQELVALDIEACDLYLNLVCESSVLLTWAKGGEVGGGGSPTAAGDRVHRGQESAESASTTFPALVQGDGRHQDAPAFPAALFHSTLGYLSSGWPVAYLMATVICGIGALIGTFTYVSQPVQVAGEAPTVTTDRVGTEPQMEVVGRITGTLNCKWAGMAADSPGVVLGRKYELASGLLEITYDTGAKVILQGPVTYEVESNGGYLSVGKLTGKLEKGLSSSSFILHPSSFTIRTPTATVTDLGTEFGVEVSENGKTTSQVFRGSVTVRAATVGGASAGRAMVLHENEAVCIGTDAGDGHGCTISRITVEPARFTRALPGSKPQERLAGDAYAEYVLSLKPAVYYRMDMPEKGEDPWTLFDSAPGAHHGALHCDKAFFAPPYSPGRFGNSRLFRGPAVTDHAIVPDYPKATDGQLTVSAWVKVTTRPVQWAMIASNWGDDKYTGQFHFGMYQTDADLAVRVTQRNGAYVSLREGESQPLPMGIWQHVVFVADGSTLRLYRNGAEVASAPCNGVLSPPPMAALGIGCKTNDAGADVAADRPAYWAGRIDELAIFNRAISIEEIKTLYKGQTGKGSQP